MNASHYNSDLRVAESRFVANTAAPTTRRLPSLRKLFTRKQKNG